MTTQPIRDKKQIRELAAYFLTRGQIRNHTLILMGIHTALRISDLLRLKWEEVWDFKSGKARSHVAITEKKTRKHKVFALNHAVVSALVLHADKREGGYIFENKNTKRAISRIQAYRVIRAAAEALKLARTSCHSLRKTFGYHALKSGVTLAVIMEIYNHGSYEVTRRYLGVTQDDKDRVYLNLKM